MIPKRTFVKFAPFAIKKIIKGPVGKRAHPNSGRIVQLAPSRNK